RSGRKMGKSFFYPLSPRFGDNINVGTRNPDPSFARSTFERYGRQLRQYLKRRSHRQQDVDDLAQEVYLRLLRVNSATRVAKPLAYVYGVAARVIADHRDEVDQSEALLVSAEDAQQEWLTRSADPPDARLEEDLALRQEVERALAS